LLIGSEVDELLFSLFQVTLTIFNQLYTVHGVYQSAVFSLVFTLLSDKQQATYETLINQLRILRPTWIPKSVMVDFEKAAINAFQKVFEMPTSQIAVYGFFFHLRKSIQKEENYIHCQLIKSNARNAPSHTWAYPV
jgi:hypothetical protein